MKILGNRRPSVYVSNPLGWWSVMILVHWNPFGVITCTKHGKMSRNGMRRIDTGTRGMSLLFKLNVNSTNAMWYRDRSKNDNLFLNEYQSNTWIYSYKSLNISCRLRILSNVNFIFYFDGPGLLVLLKIEQAKKLLSKCKTDLPIFPILRNRDKVRISKLK